MNQQQQGRLVLAPGTRVRVGFVDMNGFCGRDLHPVPDDVGRVGIVVTCIEHGVLVGGTSSSPYPTKPGTMMSDGNYCIYVVNFANDHRLEMVDHELEALV